jgi:hypothetical protein
VDKVNLTQFGEAMKRLGIEMIPADSPEAREEGSAFVPSLGGRRDDVLCEPYERTMGKDNGVRFEGRVLHIPADRHRCHYVKAKVREFRCFQVWVGMKAA